MTIETAMAKTKTGRPICKASRNEFASPAHRPISFSAAREQFIKPLSCCLILIFGCFSAHAFSVSGNLYQTDGSASDTQAAINAAPNGATVQIPNGTYNWSSQVTIANKAITLQGQSINGVVINNNSTVDGVLTIMEATSGSVVLSSINMADAGVTGSNGTLHHVTVNHTQGGQPVLVHDCYFATGGSVLVYAMLWATNGGVIWNCTFDSKMNYAGGIQFKYGDNSSWTQPSTMGMADVTGTANTYVEDCVFKTCYLGCTDFDDDSRTVIRHCQMQDSANYSHGQDTSPDGNRHWELYNNKYTFTASGSGYPLNLQDWFTIRGGTGVIFNNTFDSIQYKQSDIQFNVYSINRISNAIPCQTSYPAARQVGQTWLGVGKNGAYAYGNAPYDNAAGPGYGVDPVYIWGNGGVGASDPGFVGLNQYSPDDCGNGQAIGNYVQANRDYVLGPKPGYTPYTYPHPLRGGSPAVSQPTPLPPQSLRVIR